MTRRILACLGCTRSTYPIFGTTHHCRPISRCHICARASVSSYPTLSSSAHAFDSTQPAELRPQRVKMNVVCPQDALLTPERPRLRKNTSKFSLKSLTARVQTGAGGSASTSPASTDSRKGYHSPPLSGRLFHFPPSPPSSPLSSFSGLSSGSPSRQRTRSRDQGPPPGSPSPLLGPSAFLPPLPNTPGTLRSMGSFCVDESVRGAVKGKAAQLLGEEVVPSGKAAKVLGMEKKASYSQPRRRSSRELEDETSGDESE